MKTQRLKIFIAATALLSTASLSSAWTGDGVNGAELHGNPAAERGVNDHASESMHSSPLLRTAMDQVYFAQANLGHARETGNRRQIENAGGMLINAENMLTGILSETTGLSSAEIIDLHRSGLSWSEINIRLGVALCAGCAGPDLPWSAAGSRPQARVSCLRDRDRSPPGSARASAIARSTSSRDSRAASNRS